MSILKYKDPKTGKFKRINPYKAELSFVGKDGITINKAADSEKIEISGSGCVPKLNPAPNHVSVIMYSPPEKKYLPYLMETLLLNFSIPYRDNKGNFKVGDLTADDDGQYCANKKYVDDNYIHKLSPAPTYWAALVYEPSHKKYLPYVMETKPKTLTLPFRDGIKANFKVGDLTADDDGQYCANKNYVDNADKDLRLKLSNLEQALNGYILDTTKEAYADLDSAVLKNSVAVGDNVYPIADKTRALVTQIEGKTTKMVQLLDKSKFPATSTRNGVTFTNNGDGTITVNGTVTEDNHALIEIQAGIECIANHKYLIMGCPEGGLAGRTYGISIQSTGNPIVWDEGKGNIFSFDSHTTINLYLDFYTNNATYTNKVATPQLFDLTAMNREDITSAEQFKAEFPDLYPYENGNIYPAKISGVKFYEKQDKSGEQASVTLPETYDLHGIGDYKDYLEITKNENNELYTLKKIQVIDKHVFDGTEAWVVLGHVLTNCQAFYTEAVKCLFVYVGKGGLSNHLPLGVWFDDREHIQFGQNDNFIFVFLNKEKFKTGSDVKEYLAAQYASGNPLIAYYILPTPVETVVATNLTYEQVTAIRHNGGLIEVEGNTNKSYAKPTVTNTIVYRLTAANTTEG